MLKTSIWIAIGLTTWAATYAIGFFLIFPISQVLILFCLIEKPVAPTMGDFFRSRLRRFLEQMTFARGRKVEKDAFLSEPQPEREEVRPLAMDPLRQTQWWYLNGVLIGEGSRHWEYELVFFVRNTDWDYLGWLPMRWFRRRFVVSHFAVADLSKGQKSFRYSHKGGLLAPGRQVAVVNRCHIEVGDWSFMERADGTFDLIADLDGDQIQLHLQPTKPLVFHGENGISQRSGDVSQSSFHVSHTRLEACGKFRSKGTLHDVSGWSWLDHEKMLADRHRFNHGWDWCSLQFDSNEELMVYQLHHADGSKDENYSFATLVDVDGNTTHIEGRDLQVRTLETWTSALSGGQYPVGIEIVVRKLDLNVELRPQFKNCELDCVNTSFVAYWEGPVKVLGHKSGSQIHGRGYLELCGYDRRLTSKLIRFAMTPEPAFPHHPRPYKEPEPAMGRA